MIQVVEMSDEEKFEFYMTLEKQDVIRMLLECHKHLPQPKLNWNMKIKTTVREDSFPPYKEANLENSLEEITERLVGREVEKLRGGQLEYMKSMEYLEDRKQNTLSNIENYIDFINDEKQLLEGKILDFYARLKNITEELNPDLLYRFTIMEDRDLIEANIKYSLMKNVLDDYKETFNITVQRNGTV